MSTVFFRCVLFLIVLVGCNESDFVYQDKCKFNDLLPEDCEICQVTIELSDPRLPSPLGRKVERVYKTPQKISELLSKIDSVRMVDIRCSLWQSGVIQFHTQNNVEHIWLFTSGKDPNDLVLFDFDDEYYVLQGFNVADFFDFIGQ